MSDSWEELFALAEGRGSREETQEATTFSTTDDASKTTKKKTTAKEDASTRSSPHERSRKRARRSNAQKPASELNCNAYLDGRWCRGTPTSLFANDGNEQSRTLGDVVRGATDHRAIMC
jgi:hypothetical protein